ncbi:MAG: AI-2E family transporter [Acidobacteriia bacterium]|nr:AI-2E family transporter [Terriglobia bacterium]
MISNIGSSEDVDAPAWWQDRRELLRTAALAVGFGALAYLCGRILAPFLPALCWAFALAVIADPIYRRLAKRLRSPTLASLITVALIIAVIIVPSTLLARALFREAAAMVHQTGTDPSTIQANLERIPLMGRLLHWLDGRVNLPGAGAEVLRSAAASISKALSSLVTGSMWLLAQIGITIFVLFYFLRDREPIARALSRIVPISEGLSDVIFSRVVHIIRISLGGKAVTASIQGLLGGVIFVWAGLPAPVFWGFVMAVLSLFPVIGAFLVWGPAALVLLSQGDWLHGFVIIAWGILVINPVDNILGPILVGNTLRLHTLIMFFSIAGGLAAFGAAGIVIGPLVIAVAVSIFETLTQE